MKRKIVRFEFLMAVCAIGVLSLAVVMSLKTTTNVIPAADAGSHASVVSGEQSRVSFGSRIRDRLSKIIDQKKKAAHLDTRTPAQIAQAGCGGDGHFCTGTAIEHTMAATFGASNSPVLTVGHWYVDGSLTVLNSVGQPCASDSNSGTSATCGAVGSGIGPLKSIAVIATRVGGWNVSFPQYTTVTLLSDDVFSDPWLFDGPMGSQGIALVGTPVTVASGTFSAVTALNHAAATMGTVTAAGEGSGYWTPYRSFLLEDTTVDSYAWIYVDQGGGATTISQTMTVGPFIPSVVAFHSGDSYNVIRASNVNIGLAQYPLSAELNGPLISLVTDIANPFSLAGYSILDRVRFSGTSGFDYNGTRAGGPLLANCEFDNSTAGQDGNALNVYGAIYGGLYQNAVNLYSIGTSAYFGPELDGDVIITGAVIISGSVSIGTAGFFAPVVIPNILATPVNFRLDSNGFGPPVMWGTANLDLRGGDTVYINPTYNASSSILLTGGITIDTLSTSWPGSSFSNAPVNITPANIDYYRSLGNPATGTKIFIDGAPFVPVDPYTVTSWDVDGQNTTGCASDDNNGTSATCGEAGSRIGPLLHKREIARRWGTWSPILNGNVTPTVTVTYVSGEAGTYPDAPQGDPALFAPVLVNSAVFIETAPLPAPAFVGTLATVIPKNVATNTRLEVTLNTTSGTFSVDMLLVNGRTGSHARSSRSLGAGVFSIDQPLMPYVLGAPPTPTADNSWMPGDPIQGYFTTVVQIAHVGGMLADHIGSNPGHIVTQITMAAINDAAVTLIDAQAAPLIEDCITETASFNGAQTDLFGYVWNTILSGYTYTNSNRYGGWTFAGGHFEGQVAEFVHAGRFLVDVAFLTANVFVTELPDVEGDVYVEPGGVIYVIGGQMQLSPGAHIYGGQAPGAIAIAAGTITIPTGASWATYLPFAGLLEIGGAATAYCITTSGGVTAITLNQTNLDGTCGGLAYVPGVGGFSNGAQPFIDESPVIPIEPIVHVNANGSGGDQPSPYLLLPDQEAVVDTSQGNVVINMSSLVLGHSETVTQDAATLLAPGTNTITINAPMGVQLLLPPPTVGEFSSSYVISDPELVGFSVTWRNKGSVGGYVF